MKKNNDLEMQKDLIQTFRNKTDITKTETRSLVDFRTNSFSFLTRKPAVPNFMQYYLDPSKKNKHYEKHQE